MAEQQMSTLKTPPNIIIEVYAQMLTALFLGTLIAILLGILFVSDFLIHFFLIGDWKNNPDAPDVPLLATVMVTGALGAFFSALTRLYSFDQLPRVLLERGLKLPPPQLLMYSLVPPLVGAIAALVLYLAFAGGLVSGALFPAISCHEPKTAVDGKLIEEIYRCTKLSSLLSTDGPDHAADFARVIVWSFIAGFAERLVPNMLDSISKTARSEISKREESVISASAEAQAATAEVIRLDPLQPATKETDAG
jgi:hypothetical protein